MLQLIYISLFFLCFLFDSLLLSKESELSKMINVSLIDEADEDFKILDDFWDEQLIIKKLAFDVDCNFFKDEIKYLLDLKLPAKISLSTLKQACWNLKQKQKFESFNLKLVNLSAVSADIELFFYTTYTFDKVKCKGSIVGKDRYIQKYVLNPGEPFKLDKHSQSLKLIKQALHADGYLKAKLDDHIAYNREDKIVNVKIYIDNAKQYTIKKAIYKIETSLSESTSTKIQDLLETILPSLSGKLALQSTIEAYVDRIKLNLAQNGFYNVLVDYELNTLKKEKVSVGFRISLGAEQHFVFNGNTFFTSEQLLEQLVVLDNLLLLIPPILLSEDLEQLYKSKGFWDVKVECKENQNQVCFNIHEGKRIVLTDVEINFSNQLQRINKELTQAAQNLTDKIIKNKFYDQELMKQASDELVKELIKMGFWDACVKVEVVKKNCQNNKENIFFLKININLGEQRFLSEITIPGYSDLLNQEPFLKHKDVKKEPFDPEILQVQRNWLINEFHRKNKLAVTIKPELQETSEGIKIIWNCTFPEGVSDGEVKFGKTIITGASTTKSYAILRELPWAEGDLWDKDKVSCAIKNLKSLNIFQSVSLVPYGSFDEQSFRPLHLQCIEKDPLEIMLRLGVMQVSKTFTQLTGLTYRVGGTLLWRNPLHQADILKLDGDLTRYTRSGNLTYVLPGFYKYPIRNSFTVFTYKVDQPVIYGLKQNLYTESHNGLSFNLKKIIGPWQTVLDVGGEMIKITAVAQQLAKAIFFEPTFVDTYQPFVWFEPTLIYSNLDNLLDPHKGVYTFLSARAFIPFDRQNSPRIKCFFEQSLYYPIYGPVVGAAHWQVGHIFGAPFKLLFPTERFYLGGPTSIRSYGPRLAPPLNQYKDSDTSCAWVPVGGKSMGLLNLELRFPIYKNFGAVLFNDMGILSQNNLSTITYKSIIGGTGFGLRFASPVGLLRFDIGFKWNKQFADEKPYSWFLTFGHAF